MKILVTGGCGYVGSVLVPSLLKNRDLELIVVDTQWFGNYLKPHPRLEVFKCDIRKFPENIFKSVDVVIHLANIANDPAVDLNPVLSWEVNVLSAQQLIEKAIFFGAKQFIYASSGSVYGVKDEPEVTEDLPLVPISVYNKTKMVAERVLLSFKNQIKVHCIRPATVCGLSPRMRLDVSVNMLTYHAIKNKKITVFGGGQIRPNIHILDLVNVYLHFLKKPNLESGCYNAGFENVSIIDIAKKIQNRLKTEIIVTDSNDPRSYRQNSDKLLSTNFIQKYNIDYAIKEIISAYKNGQLMDEESCFTVKWMKKLKL